MEILLSEMGSDLQGEFSPSIYETGRVLRFAPSLRGHVQRVRFLVDEQRPDGGWGGPDGYGLVPTLSATEALLAVLRRLPAECAYADVLDAVESGLRWLFGWLNVGDPARLPDTVAIEIITPGLIAEINAQLDRLDREPLPGLGWRYSGQRLRLPDGVDGRPLASLRAEVAGGRALPTKLLHSLEVIGAVAQAAPWVEPVHGVVGCSPAATAVWLGDRQVRAGRHPSVEYLEAVQDRAGGPVPVAAPLAVFERAWVLSAISGAGPTAAIPPLLIRSLAAALDERGAAGGLGLPPDADDTATVLVALARLDGPRRPDSLWAYQRGAHFVCFHAERTPSTSANAHVLEAFGMCGTPERGRYAVAMHGLTQWLCEQQNADGCWWDKWHASPYYATRCCAVALAEYGGQAASAAVRAAVDWVLGTQRPDGSWGWWAGTYEETAYAVQTLLRAKVPDTDGIVERATARGCVSLSNAAGQAHPPLWHDKDLYTPLRIVRAEGLAALRLAWADPHVATLIADQPCCAGSQG